MRHSDARKPSALKRISWTRALGGKRPLTRSVYPHGMRLMILLGCSLCIAAGSVAGAKYFNSGSSVKQASSDTTGCALPMGTTMQPISPSSADIDALRRIASEEGLAEKRQTDACNYWNTAQEGRAAAAWSLEKVTRLQKEAIAAKEREYPKNGIYDVESSGYNGSSKSTDSMFLNSQEAFTQFAYGSDGNCTNREGSIANGHFQISMVCATPEGSLRNIAYQRYGSWSYNSIEITEVTTVMGIREIKTTHYHLQGS